MYEMTSDFKIKKGSNTVQYKSSLMNQIAVLYNIVARFGLIEIQCTTIFARKYREESIFLENKGYFTIVFQKSF